MTSQKTTPRTVIQLACDCCEDLDQTTVLEHPRESLPVKSVERAHQGLVDKHEGNCNGSPSMTVEEKRAN